MSSIDRMISFPLVGEIAWPLGAPPSWRRFKPLEPVFAIDEDPVVWSADFSAGLYARGGAEATLDEMLACIRSSDASMRDMEGIYRFFEVNRPPISPGLGLDVWGQFTNRVRNPRGEGGVDGLIAQAGSSGTVPTPWVVEANPTEWTFDFGLEEDGLPAFDVAIVSPYRRLFFEPRPGAIATAEGDAWTLQVPVRRLSGPGGVAFRVEFYFTTVAGVSVGSVTEDLVPPSTGSLSGALRSFAATAPAGAERISFALRSSAAGTFRIGAPQFCKSTVAPYPVLPVVGTPGDGVRLASDCSIPGFGALSASHGLQSGFAGSATFNLDRLSSAAVRVVAAFGEDTANHARIEIGTDDKPRLVLRKAGVDQIDLPAQEAFTTVGVKTVSYTLKSGGYSIGGTGLSEAGTAALALLPALAEARIGSGFGGTGHFNGLIERLVIERIV